MFTAIFVTRTIFEFLLERGVIEDVDVGKDVKSWRVDFMAKRMFFTGPSLLLMALGMMFFLSRDEADSKDVEFTGGEQVTVQLRKPLPIKEMRAIVGESGMYKEVSIVTLTAQSADADAAGSDATDRFKLVSKAQTAEEGDAFVTHLKDALGDRLVPPPFSDLAFEPKEGEDGTLNAHVVLNTLADDSDAAGLQGALDAADGVSSAAVTQVEGTPRSLDVSFETTLKEGKAIDAIRDAAASLDTPIVLSDPVPSSMFLNASRAEQLWRSALQAVLVAMLIQVVYIRLRFADYKHGFAAVCALIHDAVITLGIVAVADASGLVHAKINLVLIAAFLTLIGYSMNDTIVVFDRIRENLGRGKVVLSGLVNEALNQTLTRSIRTSITTFLVVFIQFLFNRGTGSVLEGFAFVMVLGVVCGTYSSIFIAAPLLLFLPVFWKIFSKRPQLAMAQVVITLVGGVLAVTSKGHGVTMWLGALMSTNIAIQFVLAFVPWLKDEAPDALLEEEIQVEEDTRPLRKPGV
jgi:SecD/SecF fusion protein